MERWPSDAWHAQMWRDEVFRGLNCSQQVAATFTSMIGLCAHVGFDVITGCRNDMFVDRFVANKHGVLADMCERHAGVKEKACKFKDMQGCSRLFWTQSRHHHLGHFFEHWHSRLVTRCWQQRACCNRLATLLCWNRSSINAKYLILLCGVCSLGAAARLIWHII